MSSLLSALGKAGPAMGQPRARDSGGPSWAVDSTGEDLGLLGLELRIGEHPRCLELAELLQLVEPVVGAGRGRRRGCGVLRWGFCVLRLLRGVGLVVLGRPATG